MLLNENGMRISTVNISFELFATLDRLSRKRITRTSQEKESMKSTSFSSVCPTPNKCIPQSLNASPRYLSLFNVFEQ